MQDSSVSQVFHCIDACLTRNPFTMATLKFFFFFLKAVTQWNVWIWPSSANSFFSLFELRTSILVQEKKDEMQCLYCSVVFVDFKLHYNNTDMLRWSCRWRRCQWCVWVWVKVCVWFQSGDISDVPYIPLLRDYRPTFCVASFFFSFLQLISVHFGHCNLAHRPPYESNHFCTFELTFSTGRCVSKSWWKWEENLESCMRSRDRSSLMRGEGSALSSSVR